VSSAKPAGVVVAQKPPASTEVDKGSKVTLNVSTGTQGGGTTTGGTTTSAGGGGATGSNVRVPGVVGLAQTPALRRLNVLELHPTVVYVQSEKPANQVVAQSPAGGVSRARGSKVTVRVSTGPNPAAAMDVPDVVGQEQADAAETLRDAGFKVVVLNRPTDDASQDGVVVDEQPGGGSSIPGGSQVTIFVGRSR
jgi:serine/threonine-protein kinase